MREKGLPLLGSRDGWFGHLEAQPETPAKRLDHQAEGRKLQCSQALPAEAGTVPGTPEC